MGAGTDADCLLCKLRDAMNDRARVFEVEIARHSEGCPDRRHFEDHLVEIDEDLRRLRGTTRRADR
ncbi:MAG: hypothetical protein M3P01_13225 [Actinomycetota bacterium]|nr:hypothetical protein [Actinomycetota bacterium]